MLFPMWVLPISTFLQMSGPPPCCQQLLADGKLVQWEPGMFCLFLSHQWLSENAADPLGQKLHVLRRALRNILSGKLKVQTDVLFFILCKKVLELSQEELTRLRQGYIWFDWFSIPQITARLSGANHDHLDADVKNAVDSIPFYTQVAHIFVCFCPSMQHHESHEPCDELTWSRRGWCRVEMLGAVLSRRKTQRLLVIKSATQASIKFPSDSLLLHPGKGEFAVQGDKVALYDVVDQMFSSHLRHLEATSATEHAWDSFRIFKAMKEHFLQGLGTEKQKEELRNTSLQLAEVESFLAQLKLSSKSVRSPTGLGPMFFAAAAGNIPVLRSCAEAKADVNEQITSAGEHPMLLILAGMSPLHSAACLNGDPQVLACLLELRANPELRAKGGLTPLHGASGAGHVKCIDFFLDEGLSIEVMSREGGRPLHAAAARMHPEAVRRLLERRATPNPRTVTGFTPLMMAAVGGSCACCQILLRHGADVHVVAKPWGVLGIGMFTALRAVSRWLPPHGPLYELAMGDGATALHVAAMSGHLQVTQLLLQSGADLLSPHRSGSTAPELAISSGHEEVAEALAAWCLPKVAFVVSV